MTNTNSARVLPSDHGFGEYGLWPALEVPFFDTRKRLKVLSPFGLFAVMAVLAMIMGAAFAFAI